MKRISKCTKTGFTLLEVMLAVVILVIASTMIMTGFIAVMAFGRNNRNYSKSGEENYRNALHLSVVGHATANNQYLDLKTNYKPAMFSTINASIRAGSPTGVSSDDLAMVVEVGSYVNTSAGVSMDSVSAVSDYSDGNSITNNRYAFFYDFNDYIGVTESEDHIIRYGFVLDPANPSRAHGDYTVPIYDDRGNIVAYGNPGWYCFNSTHTGTCRTTSFTPQRRSSST